MINLKYEGLVDDRIQSLPVDFGLELFLFIRQEVDLKQ